MGLILGIDLGTTKSVVGAWVNGKPIIVSDAIGRISIPSEILIQGEIGHQEVFVGWDCRRKNKYQNDSFVVHGIKRMMGKSNVDREKWWYEYPQYAISYILAELKCMSEEFFNQEISDAVIAIPSHFDINQRRAIIEASKIAGLNVVSLINEATASALAYFSAHPEDQSITVLDIGGGTTDISVISWGENICEVLSVDGTTQIGGVDFSNVLNTWYLDKLNEKYCVISSQISKAAEVIIRDEIELLKKELCENKICEILIPYLEVNGHYFKDAISISQFEFMQLCKVITDEIVLLVKAITEKHTTDSFLLLGGGSNTFGIKERLCNELEIKPYKGIISETSVALGAILKSAGLTNKTQTLIIDCLQDNYGIGLDGDKFEPFFLKNDLIPRSATKEFTTTENNQSSLLIKVFKGQSPFTSKNTFIGSIEINDLPPEPKGLIILIVKLDVDVNMDITISATIKGRPNFKIESILRSENNIPEDLFRDMRNKVSMWQSKRKIRIV